MIDMQLLFTKCFRLATQDVNQAAVVALNHTPPSKQQLQHTGHTAQNIPVSCQVTGFNR
jgi:hypothetical protein